jgi:hypothetical protein
MDFSRIVESDTIDSPSLERHDFSFNGATMSMERASDRDPRSLMVRFEAFLWIADPGWTDQVCLKGKMRDQMR